MSLHISILCIFIHKTCIHGLQWINLYTTLDTVVCQSMNCKRCVFTCINGLYIHTQNLYWWFTLDHFYTTFNTVLCECIKCKLTDCSRTLSIAKWYLGGPLTNSLMSTWSMDDVSLIYTQLSIQFCVMNVSTVNG